MMKRFFTFCIVIICSNIIFSQEVEQTSTQVLLETSKGNIKLVLYDDTPLHKANFLEKIKNHLYDGIIFHRVIYGFMIQAGDTASRNPEAGKFYGECKENKKIPAEIIYPKHLHLRGALAAARDDNPEKASSELQFYIVYGKRFSDAMLDDIQFQLDSSTEGTIKMSEETRQLYMKKGGSPHLDGRYTVFGHVIEGIDIVKEINWMDTDSNDRPKEDVIILKATVIE